MKYPLSRFGTKFTSPSGISGLMKDMGEALQTDEKVYMLGGGNPAHIPEVNALWRERMEHILSNGSEYERMVANYDTPQGKESFLKALSGMLNREYGWKIGPENIAITNGSQSAFFCLLNMFGGTDESGKMRKILFPLLPEYIGYADQAIEEGIFTARKPRIEELPGNRFKYHPDLDNLEIGPDIGAVCVSRPTNPTGNVITDQELAVLSERTAEKGIPLIVDNAYGAPFPNIIFTDANLIWDEHIILSMSLSKIGLPASRTGIIVASAEIIEALSGVNAILSLANSSIGQVITAPLLENGELLRLSSEVVRPFYLKKSRETMKLMDEAFAGLPYSIHVSEGSIFLWLWFKDLPVSSIELYRRLKKRNVLVIPGSYFFFGNDDPWPHRDQCLRVSYAQNNEDVRRGIEIMAEELRLIYGI